MTKTLSILLFVIILMMVVVGCSQTVSLPRETTETGGTFEEWTEKIQDDPEALLYADNCKELLDNTAQSCGQHEGFTVNNIMEITDFTADEPYGFQDTIHGGCDSVSAVGKTHEPEATTISYGTDGSSSYQVVCSSVCVWWQCTEEQESDQPPVQKIVTKDKQERAEPSLQPISGAPLCPPGTGGFTLGSPIPNRVVEQYL